MSLYYYRYVLPWRRASGILVRGTAGPETGTNAGDFGEPAGVPNAATANLQAGEAPAGRVQRKTSPTVAFSEAEAEAEAEASPAVATAAVRAASYTARVPEPALACSPANSQGVRPLERRTSSVRAGCASGGHRAAAA
jgi:hypothetical protein